MPTYDYKCNICGAGFSISAPYSAIIGCIPACPCCKSEDVKKLISKFGFILKGKDFYNTENRKEEKSEN